MFSDTLVVTVNTVDKTLVRINQDAYASEYLLREDTGEFSLRLRNTSYTRAGTGVKVDRHNVELVHTVYGAAVGDPPVIRKAYIVFENDRGDPLADAEDFTFGLVSFLTEVNIGKLLNWES